MKYKSGTLTASSCASTRVPYSYSESIGQVYHYPPGSGTAEVYTNSSWAVRGFYGPGGDWEVFANTSSAWLKWSNTSAYCRPI